MEHEFKLNSVIEKITKNIDGLETELTFIDAAMSKLSREHNVAVEKINISKELLLNQVAAYFDKVVNEISQTYQNSFESLEKSRTRTAETLKEFQSDLKSCWSFKETDKDTSFISKKKACEIFAESINTRYSRRNLTFDIKRFVEGHRELLDTMIGNVERIRVPLNEYLIKTEMVTSFEVADQEINSFAVSGDSVWVCFGAKNVIEKYDVKGNLKDKKVLDASVNDMIYDGCGNILFTSPDKTYVRKAALKQKKECERLTSTKLIKSELYLHGVRLSSEGLLVCGTDQPNYSKSRPSKSEILIFSNAGNFIKNISLPFIGKAYRVAQNFNGDYICSYPYEGVASIVNKNGGLVKISNGETSDVLQERFKPSGIACDEKGYVFISDWRQQCVLVFDKNGHFLRKIASEFAAPNALCFDCHNRLWIGDRGKISVWVLTREYE